MIDGDTLYLYVGHDISSTDTYVIPEYLCYSTKDMVTWNYEGVVLNMADVSWGNIAAAWAGQVAKRDGKYYFYFCSWDKTDGGKQSIGVAVADSPTGPFVDIGTALVKGSFATGQTSDWNDIDPTVWIETDEQGVEHRYLCWGNAAYYGVTGDLNVDANNATAVANMAAAGITFTTNLDETWGSWEQFLATLKAGTEGKITAKLVDGKLEATMTIAGASSTLVLPVDASKPVYISLFAELAKLTNIVVTTADAPVDPEPTPDPEPNPNDPPQTGDIFGMVVALMTVSGTALVALKKKH